MISKFPNLVEQYNFIFEQRNMGAQFVINHSGGKDSQAMYLELMGLGIPHDQITVIHCDLGEIEHDGAQDHIRATIDHELIVVGAAKTLFDMVRNRKATRPDAPSWPSPAYRQCTSDLKRDPVAKWIRNSGHKLVINCMGIRAGESGARAKKSALAQDNRLSKAGREVFTWYPIFEWNCRTDDQWVDGMVDDVFGEIEEHGQQPHQVYLEGNDRMSCVFCIMGSRNDFANGARLNPELLQKYAALEVEVGYTMFDGETVLERAGIIITDKGGK